MRRLGNGLAIGRGRHVVDAVAVSRRQAARERAQRNATDERTQTDDAVHCDYSLNPFMRHVSTRQILSPLPDNKEKHCVQESACTFECVHAGNVPLCWCVADAFTICWFSLSWCLMLWSLSVMRVDGWFRGPEFETSLLSYCCLWCRSPNASCRLVFVLACQASARGLHLGFVRRLPLGLAFAPSTVHGTTLPSTISRHVGATRTPRQPVTTWTPIFKQLDEEDVCTMSHSCGGPREVRGLVARKLP